MVTCRRACVCLRTPPLSTTEVLAGGDQQGGDNAGAPEEREAVVVVAATADFFRRGSYATALAATAPLAGPGRSAPCSFGTPARSAAAGAGTGLDGGEPDTEASVCMLWLQVCEYASKWFEARKWVRGLAFLACFRGALQ